MYRINRNPSESGRYNIFAGATSRNNIVMRNRLLIHCLYGLHLLLAYRPPNWQHIICKEAKNYYLCATYYFGHMYCSLVSNQSLMSLVPFSAIILNRSFIIFGFGFFVGTPTEHWTHRWWLIQWIWTKFWGFMYWILGVLDFLWGVWGITAQRPVKQQFEFSELLNF